MLGNHVGHTLLLVEHHQRDEDETEPTQPQAHIYFHPKIISGAWVDDDPIKESRVEDQVVGYHSDPNLFAQLLTLPVVEGNKLGEDSLGDGSGGEVGVGNTDLDEVDQEGGRGNRQQDQRYRC